MTRYSKFQSVANITLHFPENFGGDTTQIHYIGFKGEATQVIHTRRTGLVFVLALQWNILVIYLLICNIMFFFFFLISSVCCHSWRGTLLQLLYMNLCQILLITSKSWLLLQMVILVYAEQIKCSSHVANTWISFLNSYLQKVQEH